MLKTDLSEPFCELSHVLCYKLLFSNYSGAIILAATNYGKALVFS